MAVLGDKRLVIALFAHQQLHPGQQQREVGARLERQPVFGLARRHGVARIDHDHRHAAAHGIEFRAYFAEALALLMAMVNRFGMRSQET